MAIILEILQSVTSGYETMTLIIFLLILLGSYYSIKYHNLPPGPIGLPIFGYGPFLSQPRAKHFAELSKTYKTDILCINNYGNLFIVLNTHDLIKELYQKRTDLQDRPPSVSFRRIDPDDGGHGGIIGSNGRFWKETRRFTISVLRDFGMGRIQAEDCIQIEAEHAIKAFKEQGGTAYNTQRIINMAVSNIICKISFGKRFEYTDESLASALNEMNRMMADFSKSDHLSQIVRFFMTSLPNFIRTILFQKRLNTIIKCFQGFASFSKREVTEHRKNYKGEVNDLIDAYFSEIEKRNDPKDEIFTDRQASALITDLFLAGSETSYTTLRWTLLTMAAYPDIQQRVFDELNDVVGPDRMPSMKDKLNTPFTEAVLCEIQRLNTLVHFGVPHCNAEEDIEINGYRIPKGSTIGANLYQVHRDPDTWKYPNEFNPENFLDKGKVVNLDKLLQFSIGRRACAGESLARMELYIFFTSWIKEFEMKPEIEGDKPDLEGHYGGIFMPKSFKIRLVERMRNK